MFTGLIETTGVIHRIAPRGPGAELTIHTQPTLVKELTLGESVAVDGACLTVTHMTYDSFVVDASAETLTRTTLGARRARDVVHLERALRLGDRLGGHWVTGHVDGIGHLRSNTPLGEAQQIWCDAPPEILKYLVNKGSITVDGASLTVNEVDKAGFSIVLIPHTQSVLRLSSKPVGAAVNLESDILGKYVERLLTYGKLSSPSSLSSSTSPSEATELNLSTLAKAGFIS